MEYLETIGTAITSILFVLTALSPLLLKFKKITKLIGYAQDAWTNLKDLKTFVNDSRVEDTIKEIWGDDILVLARIHAFVEYLNILLKDKK